MNDRVAPLALTISPRLDAAVGTGWPELEAALRAASPQERERWLRQRTGDAADGLSEAIAAVLEAEDPDDRLIALVELGEAAESIDDLLADTVWEQVLVVGFETDDSELIFEASSRLAAIAEQHGDPLAAAEYFLGFLNWRRTADHGSEAEMVHDAFEEVSRLAEADGEPKAAALYTYRHARFSRLAELDDERAAVGDWESDPAPYESWT